MVRALGSPSRVPTFKSKVESPFHHSVVDQMSTGRYSEVKNKLSPCSGSVVPPYPSLKRSIKLFVYVCVCVCACYTVLVSLDLELGHDHDGVIKVEM